MNFIIRSQKSGVTFGVNVVKDEKVKKIAISFPRRALNSYEKRNREMWKKVKAAPSSTRSAEPYTTCEKKKKSDFIFRTFFSL
jgi:hypothetical protein